MTTAASSRKTRSMARTILSSKRAWSIAPRGGRVRLVTGTVYPAQLGDEARLDAPWSLQEAAGMPRAPTQSELLA
jgi:hypothetical protein